MNGRNRSPGAGRGGRRPPPRRPKGDGDGSAEKPAWGGVARRGARAVGRADPAPEREVRPPRPPQHREQERWVEQAEPSAAEGRGPADGARPRPSRRSPRELSPEVAREIDGLLGKAPAERVRRRLLDAAEAFDRERFPDAARILRTLVRDAPGVPAVRELAGLTAYRMGRWTEAVRHLEAYRDSTGAVGVDAVLADCYRALGRFAKVAELWEELRRASPPPELLTEGRLVAAGALADQGQVAEAITLLEAGPVRARRKPQPYHLRLWYALADLRERAGDAPGARELFGRVVSADPDLADAQSRLRALG